MIPTRKPWGRRYVFRTGNPAPLRPSPLADRRVESEPHCDQSRWRLQSFVHNGLLPTLIALGTSVASVLMPMAAQGTAPDTLSRNQGDTPEQLSHQCTVPLTTAIAPIITHPTFAEGHWGIVIASLETGEWLYHHNANQYFVPASNIKLLTTAAALTRLEFPTSDLLRAFYDWVGVTNRDSNNQYADALLRRLGGPETVKSTLEPLGINPNNYRQVDGSGLSRSNMAKPTVFIETLMAMTDIPRERVFYHSLPVAGHSGTLRNRFKNTSAQSIVRAKTGTLRGVRALSGYMDHPTEGPLVFSIMVNQPGQSGRTMINAIDNVVVAIAQTTHCP